MKNLLILISIIFFFSCGENTREEIWERYNTGEKKVVLKFKGEDSSEKIIEKTIYSINGDTIYFENLLEYYYIDFNNGIRRRIIKYKNDTMKDSITEKIIYNDIGDTLIWDKPIDNIYYRKSMEEILAKHQNGNIKTLAKYIGIDNFKKYISITEYDANGKIINERNKLSNFTKKIIDELNKKIVIKVYFSKNLGYELNNNKKCLKNLLYEYQDLNKSQFTFEFFTSDDDDEFKTEAQKSGIQPVQLNVIENDKMEIKQVYMGMVIMYEDKKETIPTIQTTVGLEYTITSAIKKLINTNKETIGLVSLGEANPKEVNNQSISELLRKTYDVSSVNIDNTVPTNIEALILSDVTDSLSDIQYTNLDEYLANGGNLFLAQNRIKTDIQTQTAEPIQSNIFSLLEKYGIKIKENLVLDKNCGQITISQNRGFFRMNSATDYPFFPKITDFSENEILVNGFEMIQILFPSEIDNTLGYYDGVIAGSFIPLFFTSNQSAIMEEFYNLYPLENPAFNSLNEGPFDVAALGTFQNNQTGLSSQIVVVGDSRFLADDGGGRMPENLNFLLNSIDFLMDNSQLISLRNKDAIDFFELSNINFSLYCSDISGDYHGNLIYDSNSIGFSNLFIDEDCNFKFIRKIIGNDEIIEIGKISKWGYNYKFDWENNIDYITTMSNNEINISNNNWTTNLIKD